MTLDKVIDTANAHTMGGREGGASRTDDGRLDVQLSLPGTPGAGTNEMSTSPSPPRRLACAETWAGHKWPSDPSTKLRTVLSVVERRL